MSSTTGQYRGIRYDRADLGGDIFTTEPITNEQARNLIDLADILRKIPPPEFDMSAFGDVQKRAPVERATSDDEFASKLVNTRGTPAMFFRLGSLGEKVNKECGTSCCAVGTAAYYGMGNPKPEESWEDYSKRVFGVMDDAWEFLFSGDWETWDNTPNGAAARILYLLQNGIPDDFGDGSDWEKDVVPLYTSFLEVGIEEKADVK